MSFSPLSIGIFFASESVSSLSTIGDVGAPLSTKSLGGVLGVSKITASDISEFTIKSGDKPNYEINIEGTGTCKINYADDHKNEKIVDLPYSSDKN